MSISSTFYAQIFRTNVILAAFSSYILALGRNLYEKFARKMLMKLTPGWKKMKPFSKSKFNLSFLTLTTIWRNNKFYRFWYLKCAIILMPFLHVRILEHLQNISKESFILKLLLLLLTILLSEGPLSK